MFDTILIGYDDSTQARDALTLATALADERTRIVVCCVRPDTPLTARVGVGEALHVDAQRRLDAARELLGPRPNVEYVAREARSPGAGLHGEAVDRHADLVVVGSSHRTAMGRIHPGSATEQTLHAAPCAVAVAPAGLAEEEPVALRCVGVAYDDSPESRAALDAGSALAREHDAQLRVVTSVEPGSFAVGWAGGWIYPEFWDDLRSIAREHATAAVARLGTDLVVSVDIVDGPPVQELVLASGSLDLLVLGSRGYGPVRRALLGSVSGRVTRGAACPVLVVPRPDAADEAFSEAAAERVAEESPA